MLAHIRSAAVLGVEALAIDVEVDIANGLPSFTTVGLPHGAVREGRERVAAALHNAGFALPLRRITVNLAPADVPKRGSAFDLPVAVGILAASGQVPSDLLDTTLLLGELGLEGDLRPVRGALPIALAARASGCTALILPAVNVAEAAVVSGLRVHGATTLRQVTDHLAATVALPAGHTDPGALLAASRPEVADLNEVRAQGAAKRALEVAAAGGHNLLLIGPPICFWQAPAGNCPNLDVEQPGVLVHLGGRQPGLEEGAELVALGLLCEGQEVASQGDESLHLSLKVRRFWQGCLKGGPPLLEPGEGLSGVGQFPRRLILSEQA